MVKDCRKRQMQQWLEWGQQPRCQTCGMWMWWLSVFQRMRLSRSVSLENLMKFFNRMQFWPPILAQFPSLALLLPHNDQSRFFFLLQIRHCVLHAIIRCFGMVIMRSWPTSALHMWSRSFSIKLSFTWQKMTIVRSGVAGNRDAFHEPATHYEASGDCPRDGHWWQCICDCQMLGWKVLLELLTCCTTRIARTSWRNEGSIDAEASCVKFGRGWEVRMLEGFKRLVKLSSSDS